MTPDIFKIAMPDKTLIFSATADSKRMVAFGEALHQIGAMEVGPQMFVIGSAEDMTEKVRDAIGELFEGEAKYVVSSNGDQFSLKGIVRPRTEGGVVVR